MSLDLLVLEASSISTGFRFLNLLSNVKVIDAEPIAGSRFLIVAEGERERLQASLAHAKDADFELIETVAPSVLDAIYSLAPNQLKDSLLILEAPSAVSLIKLSQTCVADYELEPIEIKIRKTGSGGGYAYLTGSKVNCERAALAARTWLSQKVRDGAIEVIDEPTEITRSLFEI